jgi:hypothetical protein
VILKVVTITLVPWGMTTRIHPICCHTAQESMAVMATIEVTGFLSMTLPLSLLV